MSDIDSGVIDKPAVQHEGPGARLTAARKAAGLTREQVAAELRLQVYLVQALEENDQARLPPAAFVTGYLRNYARLLRLPEDEIAHGHEQRNSEPPPIQAQRQKSQVCSRDLPVRLVTYIMIAGLAALIGLWWTSQQDAAAPAPSDVLVEESGAAQDDAVAPDETAVLDEGAEAEAAPAAALPSAPMVVESPEPTATQVAEPVPAPMPAADPAPPVTEAESVPQAPPLTASMPQSELTLEFSEDCWVEIQDNDGRRLSYDLYSEGGILEVRGVAPFRVFLGYAPAATLALNGAAFDHTAYHRGDVARFRVGRESDNRVMGVMD